MSRSTEKPKWHRATECSSGTCVEVARVGDEYLIRDSKNPDATPLSFTPAEWTSFLHGVRQGEFGF